MRYSLKGADLEHQSERPKAVIEDRVYDVDPDTQTLVDRRKKPRGVTLTRDERFILATRRLMDYPNRVKELCDSMRRSGLLTATGQMTPEGRLLADCVLLEDD